MQKYNRISEEIWSPEQLCSASTEDERPDTAAKMGPKLEMHNQIVLKSMTLQASLKYQMLETFDEGWVSTNSKKPCVAYVNVRVSRRLKEELVWAIDKQLRFIINNVI